MKYLDNSCSEKLQEMQSQKPVMKSFLVNLQTCNFTLREKCPNTELFSGPYFPAFSRNTGKKVPKKPPYLDTFCAVLLKKDFIANVFL